MTEENRMNEWFVPKFGPPRFRVFTGLLFLPYTGMCVSFTLIGAMLAPDVFWDRAAAISVIYFLALGVAAHALDSIGSKRTKPWGSYFEKRQLLTLAIGTLAAAYALGIYYMVLYVPLLWVVAIAEGFFVFAYNMEMFNARFHTDGWFAFSWGALPAMAGYIMQTNSVSWLMFAVAAVTGLLSYAEIKTSRPYKELKRGNYPKETPAEIISARIKRYERILKSLSAGTISAAIIMIVWRLAA